ncbi:MAG TPA: FHA domain-containing protein, partial [Polyangiaceae bacterium]
APDCDLVLEGLSPRHLEIQREGFDFLVRDVSGGSRSFRSGAPLGARFSPLNSGDLLLLGSDIMLRFEEEL